MAHDQLDGECRLPWQARARALQQQVEQDCTSATSLPDLHVNLHSNQQQRSTSPHAAALAGEQIEIWYYQSTSNHYHSTSKVRTKVPLPQMLGHASLSQIAALC